jgi:hypothetical protein
MIDRESRYFQQVDLLGQGLTKRHKDFLLSFKEGEPEWEGLGIPELSKLPAVQWKLQNIQNMQVSKRKLALAKLETVLQGMVL